MGFTLDDVRARTYKTRDAWWTVLLVDPVAARLVRWTASRTRITPNQLTVCALLLGIGSAACFLQADWRWLIAGAIVYHLSFLLDCMDGKVARLTGGGSVFGSWLDYVFDRLRVLICAMGLMVGQYRATGHDYYLLLGVLVVFLDMLRYLDALEVAKVRRTMRSRIKRRLREISDQRAEARTHHLPEPPAEQPTASDAQRDSDMRVIQGLIHADPDMDLGPSGAEHAAEDLDLQAEFRWHFPWWGRFRDALRDHRIRAHLFSGIEFQMVVFIVGPLTGRIVPTTLAAAGLLLIFELAIIYKLWLSTRDFERVLRRFSPADQEVADLSGQSADATVASR